ncbi:MAG TPA: hypothetical protein VNT53_08760 [Pseudolysinimonas sp.]|nr:hypothetical protein [Pseudolysinimonas sp.]
MPSTNLPGDEKPRISWQRWAVWIGCGGVGLFMVISGIVGIITKG